jgi:L-histidine N-alpha-methyltransferase
MSRSSSAPRLSSTSTHWATDPGTPMYSIDRYTTDDDLAVNLRAEVATGLTARPKWLPPKWFYDELGSALFEQITELDVYYPTSREWEILQRRADEIAGVTRAETLVELGSGSSRKTRALLNALSRLNTLQSYVPVDVSESTLVGAADALSVDYPGVDIHPVMADFEHHLDVLPSDGRRLIAFLGGTIGNLDPVQRAKFFAAVRASMHPGDSLLLGCDLVKDPARLVAAYDDPQGVTAEFNRNVLRVINRELRADFDVEAFAHVALWNADEERIEMWLRASRPMRVNIVDLQLRVEFSAGEQLRTELSAKFTKERVRDELDQAGLRCERWWTDKASDFALSLAIPDC